jgi:hypothetical protein
MHGVIGLVKKLAWEYRCSLFAAARCIKHSPLNQPEGIALHIVLEQQTLDKIVADYHEKTGIHPHEIVRTLYKKIRSLETAASFDTLAQGIPLDILDREITDEDDPHAVPLRWWENP